jgi:hypothetical protein
MQSPLLSACGDAPSPVAERWPSLLYCSPFEESHRCVRLLRQHFQSLRSARAASSLFASSLLILRRALLAERAPLWLLCPPLQQLTEAYAQYASGDGSAAARPLWEHFGAECTGIAQLCWQPGSRAHLDQVAALLEERRREGVVAARLLPLHFAGWLDYALRMALLDFVDRRSTSMALVLCVLPASQASARHRQQLYGLCGALAALVRAGEQDAAVGDVAAARSTHLAAVQCSYAWLSAHGTTLRYVAERLLLEAGRHWMPLWEHCFARLLDGGSAAVQWAVEAVRCASALTRSRPADALCARYALLTRLSTCDTLLGDLSAQQCLSRHARALLEEASHLAGQHDLVLLDVSQTRALRRLMI